MGLIVGIGTGRGGSGLFPPDYYYGVQWDITNSSPTLTRIGRAELHQTLPIHNLMKGCLLLDTGVVNYYLKADDWTKKADGTAAVLDGSDGQVMIEIPKHYRKFETDGNIRRAMISQFEISGFHEVPLCYVSAYEAAVNRTAPIKLWSIKNAAAEYRGGNNTSAWDAAVNSLLGKPATSISRTNFRAYARARAAGTKWNMYTYDIHKAILWLFTIEYATKNSQLAVNAALDANGYKQGGLGAGVSTAVDAEWNTFSSYNPFINCGATDGLGNYSGEVSVVMTDFGGAGVNRTFTANRYRGIENPFGHIWKNSDGVNVKIQAADAGAESQLWVATNPADFSDSVYTNYQNRGLLARASGYASRFLFGTLGEVAPSIASGGSSTYWCDYFYTSIPASGESLRTLIWGGNATYGALAGLANAHSNYAPASASTAIGSRLCYLP
jgi:hypothetical protein